MINQDTYAALWRDLTHREGHRPGLPESMADKTARATANRHARIRRCHAEGMTPWQTGRKLGLSEGLVRSDLQEMGL